MPGPNKLNYTWLKRIAKAKVKNWKETKTKIEREGKENWKRKKKERKT
jgi:hypothetical protein